MAYYGELKEDAVWSGEMGVEGDVVVPVGKTLRILPGTRISFAARPRWSCSVFRSAPEGYPIEASHRERCDLVVLGRLEILGTEEAPVSIGRLEETWGGLTLLGRSRAHLRHVVFSCAQEYLVQIFDDAGLEVEEAEFSQARIGILAWGLSQVRCRGARFEGLDCGILCREGSAVDIEGSRFLRTGHGVWAQQWSLARTRDCGFEGCSQAGAAVYDRARLRVFGGEFLGCARGVLGGSFSHAQVENCRFKDNPAGAYAQESACLEVIRCRFEGEGAPCVSHGSGNVELIHNQVVKKEPDGTALELSVV